MASKGGSGIHGGRPGHELPTSVDTYQGDRRPKHGHSSATSGNSGSNPTGNDGDGSGDVGEDGSGEDNQCHHGVKANQAHRGGEENRVRHGGEIISELEWSWW